MQLTFEKVPSPIDPLFVVSDGQGHLRALEFSDREERLHRLLRLHYGTYGLKEGTAPEPTREAIAAYFDGELDALDEISVATGGTVFQRQVWRALREIPPAATRSYGHLAKQLGRDGASRAVGAANGSNPIALVVPCHRVIGSAGTLTGYAGGLQRKQWLLDHERRCARAGQAAVNLFAMSQAVAPRTKPRKSSGMRPNIVKLVAHWLPGTCIICSFGNPRGKTDVRYSGLP